MDGETQNTLLVKIPKTWVIHSLRIVIFACILLLIRLEARTRKQTFSDEGNTPILLQHLEIFDGATTLGPASASSGLHPVLDQNQRVLGYLMATSPEADHLVGFSGPTNVIIAFDSDLKVTATEVAWSRDTREHVSEVNEASQFWMQFVGLSWQELAGMQDIDAVSGATLTSLTIAESIILRVGGDVPSLRFPEPMTVADIQSLYPDAQKLVPSKIYKPGWEVLDENITLLGFILSTSPESDDVVGYQGPTETLIAMTADATVSRIHVRKSFDNQPYVSYLNEDWSWPELFKDLTLDEVAHYDLEANGVEGVSGATFTSMAVARGVIRTAQRVHEKPLLSEGTKTNNWKLTSADYGTLGMIFCGVLIASTHLRGIGWLRVVYQFVLIGYVGFLNGDLLSLAMLVGWVQNGIPWNTAARLVVLVGIAFTLPVATKRNVYCTHLCPHGALQQLARNRLKFQFHPGKNLKRLLLLIPIGLLVWVIVVAMLALPFSLVDIEPFDAYLFRIAGWSAIAIAVLGLIASLFVPMAYCRFGCPTGVLLEYFRRTRQSDRLHSADAAAFALLILTISLYWA